MLGLALRWIDIASGGRVLILRITEDRAIRQNCCRSASLSLTSSKFMNSKERELSPELPILSLSLPPGYETSLCHLPTDLGYGIEFLLQGKIAKQGTVNWPSNQTPWDVTRHIFQCHTIFQCYTILKLTVFPSPAHSKSQRLLKPSCRHTRCCHW